MELFENGKLYAGCNYWASHAGVKMWSDWNEKTVDEDFKLLASIGIQLVRVFPLWNDFQPIEPIYGYAGNIEGYSTDGDTLLCSDDSGISEVMLSRFEIMLDIADKYGIKVIPSLITGWMSGRLFIPTALYGKNLITDPIALKWEVRFIKAFVKRFKYRNAIAAWCLGNECNCMSKVTTSEQAWVWLSTLSDAFRSVDKERAVISGMHSQFTPNEGHWTLQDCGENCDYVTTHPYASPEYETDRELMNTIKPMIHPAAQTVYSAALSGKPCFIEETGTYGQMYGDEEMHAKYAEGALYTAWVHNCLGYLWWIGFDQGSLSYHPFGYNNRASNYGLFREDKTIKPVGNVIKNFNSFASSFGTLPPLISEAVCIVTPDQNTWKAAGSSFILGKQARIDMTFAYSKDALPDAEIYIIPSLHSSNAFSSEYIKNLMLKVENGATLYISLGCGFPRNLTDDFGFKIKSRTQADRTDTMLIGEDTLPLYQIAFYDTEPITAESLAVNSSGKDVFFKSKYGKGTVMVLMYPAETYLYKINNAYEAHPYYKIYDEIRKTVPSEKVIDCDNRMIGITEHPVSDKVRTVVITNYGSGTTAHLYAKGWKFKDCRLGTAQITDNVADCRIENAKTAVFTIEKA